MSFVIAAPPAAQKVPNSTTGVSKALSFIDTIIKHLTDINPNISQEIISEVSRLLGLVSSDELVKSTIKHHNYTYLAAAAALLVQTSVWQAYRPSITTVTERSDPDVTTVKAQAMAVMSETQSRLLPELTQQVAAALTSKQKAMVIDNIAIMLFQELCYLLSLLESNKP